MGEIHTVMKNNEVIPVCKLGAMENMYYARRLEACFLLPFDAKQETDISELLFDREIIWRFPFPDEDLELSFTNATLHNQSYSNLINSIVKRSTRTFNFIADKEPILTSYHDDCIGGFKILGERFSLDLVAVTVFSCDGCNRVFSLSNTEIQRIKVEIINNCEGDDAFIEQVAYRLHPNPLLY